MHRSTARSAFILSTALLIAAAALTAQYPRVRRTSGATPAAATTEGTLYRLNARGESTGICPLKHTDVKASISGQLARVNVTQEFV
ncbi:hypothetical protein J8J20_21690, partial [Mycobacterium tuberculosis]|nr:hypothetical protein [Mycobacterium tuberculosis]